MKIKNRSANKKVLDELLGLDGEEEFAIYMAPVGKVKG